MGVFKRLAITASILLATLFSFGATPAIVTAQVSDNTIQEGLCTGASLKIESTGDCEDIDNDGAERISRIVTRAINTLSLIVGIVAVVMIMIGGLRYITSGGSDASVTSAKNTILYAIIGLIIVALSQVMVRFVLKQITE